MVSKKRIGGICIALSMILISVVSFTYFLPTKKVVAADQTVIAYGRNTIDDNVYRFKLYLTGEIDEDSHLPLAQFAGFDPTYTYLPTTKLGIPLDFYEDASLSGDPLYRIDTISADCCKVDSSGVTALVDAKDITELSVPEGVKEIKSNTFSRTLLATASLPSSLEILGDSAFSGCGKLTRIDLSAMSGLHSCTARISNPELDSPLHECTETHYSCAGVFNGCTILEEVLLPDNATNFKTIGANMFAGCGKLSTITIPNSVVEIGSGAFSGDTGIESVGGARNIVYFGNGAFSGCKK